MSCVNDVAEDGGIMWDRQYRWVGYTPQAVYAAICVRVCEGFSNHYYKASSKHVGTRAAEEQKHWQDKTEYLAPWCVGSGQARDQWLKRVYDFPVDSCADFAKLLLCHPSLAYLDSAVMSGRVRVGMQVQLQVTTCLSSPCQACDVTAPMRHVLTHTQASQN